jgi:acyl-CoA synthetase (AMP-forming)/AMP-acid ligase II
MSGQTALLECAQRRAAASKDIYRRAGLWSGQPVDVVRSAALGHAERVALIARGRELTYAELDERIDRACGSLAAAGVRASTPVIVVVGNDVESVVAVHSALRLDAVILLIPRSAGETQVADIIARTGAKFGIAPNWPAASEPGLSGRATWIALDVDGAPCGEYRSERAADEPCLVLYTSGTTSRPKGVIHSLSTLLKASSNYIAAAGLADHDRIFLVSPLASVTGVLQGLFIGPMLAAPVILEDRWDPSATCELLVSSGATWYGGPDRLLDRILDEAVARGATIPLRAVYLGGTMLDRRIVERIEDEFGIIVMRAYGSSEVPVSTSGLRGEPRDVRHADDGVALADVEVRVGSSGDPTECCIRGAHTFLGYTDVDDDAAAFDGDWFRTGDVAELDHGRIRIVGRLKDIIIRNGLKIPAAEVEEAVTKIPGVVECAAYSVADSTTGERLAVAVVLESARQVSLAEVTDVLVSAGLPKYKLPEELVFWDEPLPVNANGKVERNTLDARSAGRPRALADRLSTR